MKSNLHILPILSGTLLILSVASGCSKSKPSVDVSKLPEDVKPTASAIVADSAPQFASAVNYPLERPYPLPDIKDSAEMVRYYPTLIDDSIKSVVTQSPDSLWAEDGWRGWTLDQGEYFWIDAGKVYKVNYISRREKDILDSLRSEEISTLDPSLRKGWVPVLCIIDSTSGKIFRIDSDETITPPQYRLAGYSEDSDLSGLPSLVLYGNLDVDGTMETRLFHFEDSVGTQATYSPDIISEEDTVQEIQVLRHGKRHHYKVKPGYWLDQIRRRNSYNDKTADNVGAISSDIIVTDTLQ